MSPRTAAIATILLVTAIAATGSWGAAQAQPATQAHDIPQSVRLLHQEDIATLTALARLRAPVGPAARKALDLLKRHHQREEAYILPPLTLLGRLADGKVDPDMKWAIAMADRVKADREEIFQEHTQITEAMNALLAAAERAHNTAAAEFARGAVADSLGDMELLEPMTVVIGDYLRSKLPAGQ